MKRVGTNTFKAHALEGSTVQWVGHGAVNQEVRGVGVILGSAAGLLGDVGHVA